jgi:hypothetical protein
MSKSDYENNKFTESNEETPTQRRMRLRDENQETPTQRRIRLRDECRNINGENSPLC